MFEFRELRTCLSVADLVDVRVLVPAGDSKAVGVRMRGEEEGGDGVGGGGCNGQ